MQEQPAQISKQEGGGETGRQAQSWLQQTPPPKRCTVATSVPGVCCRGGSAQVRFPVSTHSPQGGAFEKDFCAVNNLYSKGFLLQHWSCLRDVAKPHTQEQGNIPRSQRAERCPEGRSPHQRNSWRNSRLRGRELGLPGGCSGSTGHPQEFSQPGCNS